MLSKFWNNKVSGLPLAFRLIISSIYRIIIRNIISTMIKYGLGKCGERVTIYKGFDCRYPGSIFLGDDVLIDYHVKLYTEVKSTLTVHNRVSIGRECKIDFSGGIVINESAHLAEGVTIITHDHGFDYRNPPVGKRLEIGKNVFVGRNSTILYNVNTIGDNAVIGVGSVVTKEVPPYAIVAGNPARIIKYRGDV